MPSLEDQAPLRADSTSPSGILFNKPDLRALQRYRMMAAALPTDERGVRAYLGALPHWPESLHSLSRALSPGAFLRCFTDMTEHAGQWASLESRLRITSQKLVLFADRLTAASLLVTHTWNHSALGRSTQTQAEAQALNEEAQTLKTQCAAVLGQISEHAERLHGHAKALLSDLSEFRRRLEETIMGELVLKIELVHRAEAKLGGSAATTRVAELNERYKQLLETYEAYASAPSSWDVALAKSIVRLFIVDPEQETRQELEAVSQQHQEAIRQVVEEQRAALAVSHMLKVLPRVAGISVSAKVSAGRVVDLWSGLQVYADQQALRLGKITDTASLHAYYREFLLMVAPWQEIAATSQHLKGTLRG
ncbi:hypothetical protein [Pseudomonas sp. nanlin1]|uniref:hypothetical protein n=1 Tax=Pseudomonas sp. nanlin1 TaxID=3040605 RepID=UPI00388DBC77